MPNVLRSAQQLSEPLLKIVTHFSGSSQWINVKEGRNIIFPVEKRGKLCYTKRTVPEAGRCVLVRRQSGKSPETG